MEPATFTQSQLKAIYREFSHSRGGNVSFAQFKLVCRSHRDLLIPQSYSESDFNAWVQEQFGIIIQRSVGFSTTFSSNQRGNSKSKAYPPSSSKKYNQPRQFIDATQSPDGNLRKTPSNSSMSNGSQNRRNPRNPVTPNSRSSSSNQPQVPGEDSGTSSPELNQLLTFEGFCKNYKCAISLRKLVPEIADQLRDLNVPPFATRDADDQDINVQDTTHKDDLLYDIEGIEVMTQKSQTLLKEERKHLQIQLEKSMQKQSDSNLTKSENLRYRALEPEQRLEQLLLSQDVTTPKNERITRVKKLRTEETKDEENQDSDLHTLERSLSLKLEMKPRETSHSSCSVRFGSKVTDQTINNLISSPSQTTQNLALYEKIATAELEMECKETLEDHQKQGGVSMLANAMKQKSEESGKDSGTRSSAFHDLRGIEVQLRENKGEIHETQEPVFEMQEFQVKGQNLSTIVITGGEQQTVPLNRASAIKKRDSSLKTSPRFPFSNRPKSSKDIKSKGCACTGGKGCMVF